MKIGQISTLNPNLAYRNDIQLGHYRTQDNQQMVMSYQFSARGVAGKKATVELLELLCRAITESSENRFLLQATFGHGKSHFGLALANFFGKEAASTEVTTLLDTIQHVSGNAAKVGDFKSFKANRKPFLVLTLRGDKTPDNLRDKVFQALYEALQDHEATASIRPPFWFDEALCFVERLSGEDARRAEAFLKPQHLDLALLKASLEQYEGRHFELCRNLFKELYGTWPDFGRQTSLSDALDWAATELCGHGKGFGGLLVLFDEFSLFVKDYVQQTGAPLQELLNGVDQQRGKLIFVAFSQHEPERWARDGTTTSEALKKELERLPRNNRYNLQASLEDVLRGYFKEDESAWREFMHQDVAGQVVEATTVAYEAFKPYYQSSLGWSEEKFQEAITKDCFPLHPLTTVLLSSLQLEQAATTRSVIGYLTDEAGEVKRKLEEEAVVDGKVNWVLPISLVDYFRDMLNQQVWEQYQNVKVPDLSDAQSAVLKAMVLQRAAETPTKGLGKHGFEILIGELAGLSRSESKVALEALEKGRYIREDKANGSYAFWAGSNGAVELERLLAQRMDALRAQRDAQGRNKLTGALDDLTNGTNRATELMYDEQLSGLYPVPVKWGHAEDWAADEILLSRAGFTRPNLEALLASTQVSATAYPKRRGAVIRLLAEGQADVDYFAAELETILDLSATLKTASFLVMRPKSPHPDLVKALLKYTVASDADFAKTAIAEIGRQDFDEEKKRLKQQLEAGLAKLRGDAQLVATLEARGKVETVASTAPGARRLEVALKELYAIVYRHAPDAFFDQYRHASNTSLRKAVMTLLPALEANNVVNVINVLATDKVAKDILDKFLSDSWGVLTRQQQLQPPTSGRLTKAWEYLDATFPEGETTPVDKALLSLFNPPYGYDYNTLTLLFACWYGYNKRDLELYLGGRMATLTSLISAGRGKPDDFIKALSKASLRRRKRSELDQKVKDATERIEKGGLNQEQAEQDAARLKRFQADDDSNNERLTADVAAAVTKVTEALERLAEYDAAAASIETSLGRAKAIADYSAQLNRLDKLPTLFTVRSTLPSPDEIRKNILERLERFVTEQCEANEKLARLTDYGKNESQLKQLKRELERLNLSNLEARVGEALRRLDEARDALTARQQEEADLRAVEQIQTSGVGLRVLVSNKERVKSLLSVGTERVQIAAEVKLTQLEQKINDLRAFTVTLPERIELLDDAGAARQLGNELLRRRSLYEGTADLKDLDADSDRITRLEAYFTELERPIAPRDSAEAATLAKQTEQLAGNFSDALNAQQAQRAQAKLEQIRAFVGTHEIEAQAWLESVAADLAAGHDLRALRSRLSAPPSFFPEVLEPRRVALSEQVEAALLGEVRESQRIEAITHLPETGTVVQLQNTLRQLSQHDGDTGHIRAAAEKKRTRVKQHLDRLVEQVSSWQQSLLRIGGLKEANRLAGDVQRAENMYQGSELQGEIEALAHHIEIAIEVLRICEGPDVASTYADITARQQQLRDVQSLSARLPSAIAEALGQKLERQQKDLHERTTREQHLLEKARDDIASVRQLSDLATIDNQLTHAQRFFCGSEQDAVVSQVLECRARLGSFFEELHRIEVSAASTPDEVLAQRRAFKETRDNYGELLQAVQQEVVEEKITNLDRLFQRKQQEAGSWLDKRQQELAQATTAERLNRLQRELQVAPAFLSDETRRTQAEMLSKIATRLDGLELEVIESYFKKLAPVKRQECLERLTAILREQPEAV